MAPVPTKMTSGSVSADGTGGLPVGAFKPSPPSPPIHSAHFSTPPSTPPLSNNTTSNGLADKTDVAKSRFGSLAGEKKPTDAPAKKGKQPSNSKASVTSKKLEKDIPKQGDKHLAQDTDVSKEAPNVAEVPKTLVKEAEPPKQGSHQGASTVGKSRENVKELPLTSRIEGEVVTSASSSTAALEMSASKPASMDKELVGPAQGDKPSNGRVVCQTNANGRVNECTMKQNDEGTYWTVTLDCCGEFCLVDNQQKGNIRIAHWDSLELKVLAGTFPGDVIEHLKVVDPLLHETKTTGKVDELGTWSVSWQAAATPLAGPYKLQLVTSDKSKECLANTVIVEPRILLNGQEICSSALCVQTVLSRCLGPLKRWKRMMTSTAELGYNMLHFTPVQTPGESGSCYSIANQHEVDARFFDDPNSPRSTPKTHIIEQPACALSEEKRLEEFQAAVEMLERDLGLLSTTDLVLNHTASNSSWIAAHPDCGYSPITCPHLKAACELDISIKEFSDDLVDKKFEKDFAGLCEYIRNEADLGRLLWAFNEMCLKKFKMHEWFQLDIETSKTAFEGRTENTQSLDYVAARKAMLEHVTCMVGSVRGPKIVVPKEVSGELCKSKKELADMLNDVQNELYRMAKETEDAVLSSIEGHVRYDRVECQKGPVGKEHWESLVPRYFTAVKDDKGELHYLANNGWVMDWDATKDFAARGCLVYLRRQLVAWSDCIKLRYGQGPDDAPFLWNWMTKYCQQTAKIVHGVRLDNCHSTPIHVAKHMLRECRKLRPNLWVYAELFTGEQKVDQQFERELGINALIREAMQTHSSRDLGLHAVKYCRCNPVGALSAMASSERDNSQKKHLKPALCPALFYDCTHDNESPNDRRTPQDALPTAAIVCACSCAVGSTRGFDEMVPHQLDVVTESRLYQDYQPAPSAKVADASEGTATPPEKPETMEVNWYGGSNDGVVCVRGDWDGWAEDVPCELQPDGTYRATLKVGKQLKDDCENYQYKFVVSGQWCHDNDQPCARDSEGNINNVLSVSGSKPTGCHSWRAGEALPGFMEVKGILNRLHTQMAERGYSEMDVESIAEDILLIRRHNPDTHACAYFVIRSAFGGHGKHPSYSMPEVLVPGKVSKCYVAASLSAQRCPSRRNIGTDPVKINGLEAQLKFKTEFGDMAEVAAFDEATHLTRLRLRNFPPASVLVFSTYGYGEVKVAVEGQLGQSLQAACQDLDLSAVSFLLYSCENEENDLSHGTRSVYEIPGHGKLVYSGLVGSTSLLDMLRASPATALQHPLCDNLRGGDWLLEYLSDRLEGNIFSTRLEKIKAWIVQMKAVLQTSPPKSTTRAPSECSTKASTPPRCHAMPFGAVPTCGDAGVLLEEVDGLQLPYWLRPYYVDLIICRLYYTVQRTVLDKMGGFIGSTTDPFVKDLAMASLQFYGYVPSGSLEFGTEKPSLCAGLPHFSTGCMRNWGRDTFIALPGILLATGRFSEARSEILGFSRVVRHGLVPNLLDGGSNPRYNARDASWFFLQAIQDYCLAAPEGKQFLKTEIELKFPVEEGEVEVQNIGDLMHHMLSKHAKGITFREWNAGVAIDEHMKMGGFDIEIKLDTELGLPLGGNAFNCGTWMDKMGSSHKAYNKGHPATPRDGTPVEIAGLLKSTLRFLTGLPSDVFPHTSVTMSDESSMTYKEWNDLVAKSFEKHFYVPTESDSFEAVVDPKHVNRKQIYKDVLKASHPWCDYQLRPNFCVAMAVAPELFDRTRARAALDMVKDCLWGEGQLGLKTLDPTDLNYRGNYDNADDGDDRHTAHGWNYHQGPEWLWPLGYFLQAQLLFASEDEKRACKQECLGYLSNHREHIRQSPWRSLPELTNQNGQECAFSCPAQAWSVATILSFLQKAVLA
eukprot:GHVS01066912.1.p1 GENE.GHVS01066912.1~~GHVS01066912.1.p1  ORF type:complete len:1880 (+),score=289.48 GHVS01066912.1:287-5926(+)